MATDRKLFRVGLFTLALLALLGVAHAKDRTPVDLRFSDATAAAGIDFVHSMGAARVENILQSTGAGVCMADYDGDGLVDLYFVDGAAPAASARAAINRLYRNVGGLRFEDVTAEAGVGDLSYGHGCVFADYDNDSDLDLYVTNYGRNVLYRNDGEAGFVDVTESAGVGGASWSTGATFGDCDRDGDLDLYVVNYLDYTPGQKVKRGRLSVREGYTFFPGPRDYGGQADTFYRNRGDGTFKDESQLAGVADPAGKGLQAVFADTDGDGDADLYVANDRTPNFLYTNDGDCRFEEEAVLAGVALDKRGDETGAMGIAVGDVDLDGRIDLLVTNMVFEYDSLFRNQGDGLFEDLTRQAGIAEKTYPHVGWGADLFDADNDGDLDLAVANGHVHDHVDIFSDSVTYEQDNLLFLNRGDGTFADVTRQIGDAFRGPNVSRGLATADLDNDGDIDVVITNLNAPPVVLRNELAAESHWLTVALSGRRSNRDAIGARVVVEAAGQRQVRDVRAGSSYLSQSDRRLHFGLGTANRVDRLEVTWPSGETTLLENVPVDEVRSIAEGEG